MGWLASLLVSFSFSTACPPRRTTAHDTLEAMYPSLAALAGALAAAAAGVAASPIDAVRATTLAPLYTPPPPVVDSAAAAAAFDTNSHIIRDSYIVVLHDHLEEDAVQEHHAHVHALHARHAHDASANTAAAVYEGIRHTFHVGGKKHRSSHHHERRAPKQLKGYSGHFAEQLVDQIRALEGVKYVERDSIVHTRDVENGAPWVRTALRLISAAAAPPPPHGDCGDGN